MSTPLPRRPSLLTTACAATLFAGVASAQFGAKQTIPSPLTEVDDVLSVDLDGDGDLDVLATSGADFAVVWFENLGGGSYSAQQAVASQATLASNAVAADFDADGDLDVLTTSHSLGTLTLSRNDGAGGFGPQEILLGGIFNPGIARSADVDGDGDIDALVSDTNPNLILWVENLGTGAGPVHTVGNVVGAQRFEVADLDFDGDVDVVAIENGEELVLFENQGAGAFAPAATLNALGSISTRLILGDVDQDGFPDIVVNDVSGTGTFGFYPSAGFGSFGAFQSVPSSPLGVDLVHLADLDSDGDLDVLVGHGTNGSEISWIPNLGFGQFGSANPVTDTGATLNALSTASLNVDGDLELLTGSSSPAEIAWYDNQSPPGTSFCTATVNSTGQKGFISSAGSASASQATLVLTANQVPDHVGIFFHGWGALTPALPFGDGDLCIAGDLTRGAPVLVSGNQASYAYDNSDAQHSLTSNVGITRKFQFWFRDPGAGFSGFNLTSGFAIAVLP